MCEIKNCWLAAEQQRWNKVCLAAAAGGFQSHKHNEIIACLDNLVPRPVHGVSGCKTADTYFPRLNVALVLSENKYDFMSQRRDSRTTTTVEDIPCDIKIKPGTTPTYAGIMWLN